MTDGAVPHRNLDGDVDPWGPDVHQVSNNVDSMRWGLTEIGTRGLSGFLRRREMVVQTSRIDEDGYVPPDDDRDDNGPATVRVVTPDALIGRLAMNYLIWKSATVGRGENKVAVRTECFFPADAARLVLLLADEAPNLRILRGVTHTPMVRKDGTILDQPGYDDASGYLYLPAPGLWVPPVPERPTRQQIDAAVSLLRDMVDEFAWAGEHDEACFLGALLTPLLRPMCPPPYKLVGIMAHQRGSGKSLLAWIIREVHGGVFRSEMPAKDEELEKVLSSILSCTTAPVVTIDNVSGVLQSSRFEGLLTSAIYGGRILGSTNNVELDNDRLWTLTGNNLSLAGDLDRRTMLITIDPMVPKPELRIGFRLDLTEHVPANRGRILHALLTLVSAWVAAGKPMEVRSSDSYAHWSGVVRGILRHAGVPGEFDHPDCAPEPSSTDPEGWGDFLRAARKEFDDNAWTAKDLLAKVHDGRDRSDTFGGGGVYDSSHPIALDALPQDLGEKLVRNGPAGVTRGLGKWLGNRNRRFVGDLACVESGERSHSKLWRVLTSEEIRNQRGHAA